MAQVLRPRLELLRRPTRLLPELNQGVAQRVRLEIGQTGALKGLAEDAPDRLGGASCLTLQAARHEVALRPDDHPGCWKQGITIAP